VDPWKDSGVRSNTKSRNDLNKGGAYPERVQPKETETAEGSGEIEKRDEKPSYAVQLGEKG